MCCVQEQQIHSVPLRYTAVAALYTPLTSWCGVPYPPVPPAATAGSGTSGKRKRIQKPAKNRGSKKQRKSPQLGGSNSSQPQKKTKRAGSGLSSDTSARASTPPL